MVRYKQNLARQIQSLVDVVGLFWTFFHGSARERFTQINKELATRMSHENIS